MSSPNVPTFVTMVSPHIVPLQSLSRQWLTCADVVKWAMASKKQALTWAVGFETSSLRPNCWGSLTPRLSVVWCHVNGSRYMKIYIIYTYIYVICFTCTLFWSLFVGIPMGLNLLNSLQTWLCCWTQQRGAGLLPPLLMFLLWTRPTLELLTAAWLHWRNASNSKVCRNLGLL